MAEIKKYLDTVALGALVDQIKAKDADTLAAAKDYAEKLGVNYDAAGAAAGVQANLELEIARADAAEKTNAAAAKKAQDEVDALEALVGALPEGSNASSVVEYINIKTSGIATEGAMNELNSQFGTLKGRVDTIEGDYLKAADKAEVLEAVEGVQGSVNTLAGTHATDKKTLEDAIALKADQSALDGVSAVANAAVKQSDYDTKMTALEGADTRIEGLVTAEAERATGAEAALEARIEAMEVFWDATEDNDGIVNKLKEIQDYIANDESGAAGMLGNIQENTQAIADMDAAYKAAVAGVQGEVDALEAVVDGKADASVVEALEADVADMIADAKQEAIDSAVATAAQDAANKDAVVLSETQKYVDDKNALVEARIAELETASATHALASDVEAIDGRVEAAEGKIETLQTEMDAVEALAAANKAAHEANTAAIALKAAQADLEAAIARITKNETDIGGLNTAVSEKAAQADLEAAIARIAKNETDIAANTSAIGSFTAITPDEINAMFA